VAAISHLVSTAAGEVLAFGTTYEAGELVAWMTSDGATWVPVQTDGLNARIGPIAAGPSGVVTTTAELSAAGWNPRLVRSADGRTWEAEPDGAQAIPRTDSAVVGACPEPPTTMVDWLAVPGAVGAECFGDAPITFVGWSTVAGGCGGFAPGIFEPDWLASMFATGPLILTPFEAEYGGCGSAAAHPTLGELPEPQQWVEVTGHWADPESASCRHRPDPQYPGAAGGGSLEFECRSRFVATQVIGAR
jgi:hypothetical protein